MGFLGDLMRFWKSLFGSITKNYTKPSETKKETSLSFEITPDKKQSENEKRNFSQIIEDASTGKGLKPGEGRKILQLMMPENPIDKIFEVVINKKGTPFLPEMDDSLLKQDVFVVDFKPDQQPKVWEGDVLLYSSQNRLDQGQNLRPNVTLSLPTTKTSFQDFLRDLKEGSVVTLNSMTPAAGCFEWKERKFSYRGLPKK